MAYTSTVKNEAKRLVIESEMTFDQVSEQLGGRPVAQTIANWANAPDEEGRTWMDLRRARADERYEQLTPEAMARRLMQQMFDLLQSGELDTKKADALAKFNKVLKEVSEPKFQVSIMYQLLEDFLFFLKAQYAHLVNPELLAALRDFKNELRTRLLPGAS